MNYFTPLSSTRSNGPHNSFVIQVEERARAANAKRMSPASTYVLPRGYESCEFTAADLQAVLAQAESADEDRGESGEWEPARLSSARGAAAAALGAPLAEDVASRGAELVLSDTARLRLRLLADLPPGRRPPIWFDEAALAALNMPFLTLANIRGGRSYACHSCGALFERPNPLKLHLFLACAVRLPAALAVWRRALPALAAPPAPAPAPAPAAAPAPALDAARLEALAAEWGRARGGHVCVYCGKLYSRKYGLKIHIRTHTGYKPLRCRYCARAFGDPSNLNKHVRLHAAAPDAAAPLHACALCGKRLVRRRDLERHVRARHALCAAP